MLQSTKTTLVLVYLGIYLNFLSFSNHAKILNRSFQYVHLASSQTIPHSETATKKNSKNAKIQVGNKVAMPTNISKDGLPHILYDHQALLDVINEIPMGPLIKEKAILYLKNIEHKVDDIKRYQSKEHIEHFYHPMKEALLDIHNSARALYELTKPYHLTLSNTLRKLILHSIASFEIELNKRMEMSVAEKEALNLKTKRLYAEQSYVVRQKELHQKLMAHLTKLKQLLTEAGKPFPCCYMSYAWPSKENRGQEYWVQPFLSILYDHLTTAGIRVMMDIRDREPGDRIYQLTEQYHKGSYVILVGTESLLQKHYSIIPNAIQTELSIISDRFEQDQKELGYSRIYPLLISGTIKTSFPEIYDKYHTIRDAREAGYLLMLQHLIDWIYEQQVTKVEAEYTRLWHTFYENYPGLPKDADVNLVNQELNLGYHRKRLDYLKRGTHFQTIQEQDNYSSNVENEVVAKSKGSYPKHNEYGQQFQRPSITPDFIERQGLWEKIVDYFNQSDQQILTLSAFGLGGMGKTELAKYYYLHPPRPYALRAWFNAENKEQLYAQYADLAKVNGIEFSKGIPIQEQASQLKKWLESQENYLLVYDNVPHAKQVEGLLPEQGNHHILITSRSKVDWSPHQRLDIDVMEEQEAIALICKITDYQGKDVRLQKLVSTLHYLPLALAQAGAYIAENKTSIEDYLNLYQRYQSLLMTDKALARNPKHEPVWTTFNMNFKALEVECPNALLTLKQASWLDASVIPEVLLKTMLKDATEEPIDLLWGDVKKHIGRYSLMRIDREGHQLNIHRLVQDILRSKQSKLERKRILNQIALSIKSIYPESNRTMEEGNKTMENINMVKLLLPHTATILSHLKKYFREKECTNFNLAFILGDAYETIGNYAKAKENFHYDLLVKQKKYKDDHIKMRQAIGRSNHSDIAHSLDHLGRVCGELSEYQEALKYHQQALEIKQALYTGNHPDIAASLDHIGFTYYYLGKHQEALNYHQQALEIRQALYTGNHLDIATSLDHIGFIYYHLSKHQEALKYTKQALEIRQSLYTGNHPDIAHSLNDIGLVYHVLGNYQEALKCHEQALKIRQALYTGNHPDIALSLHNIGFVYLFLGKYQEALKYNEQALKMEQDIYTGNHFLIAFSLHNIGSVYKELGNYQEALKYYEQALKMEQAIYPPGNHPDIAISLDKIGSVYYFLGEYQEALKYYEQAIEMYQIVYPGNHFRIATSFNNVGLVYHDLGNYQKALKYYEQALEMEQDIYSGNHPNIAKTFNNIGNIYQALGELDKASKYHEQALAMRQAIYADDHPDIATSSNNLGSVYFKLGEIKKSMELYKRALTIYKNKLPPEHIKISKTSNNLGNAFLSLGKYNEGKELFEKTLATITQQYGSQHTFTATVMANLGNTCRLLGDHLQSKKLLENSLEILKAHYKSENADIARVMGNLALLYGELGNSTKKKEYLKKALAIFKKHLYKSHPDIMKTFNDTRNRNGKKDRSKVLGYPLIFLF